MTKDKDRIAIVIATHNNATTIKRAIESATGGSRPADRIIVGDNDSTDGTYDILCNLLGAKKISVDEKTGWPPEFDGDINSVPVHIFRKRLSTIGHTLNIAMQMKWQDVTIFGFMEPTSWYTPDKIQQAVQVFGNNQAIACVISDCYNHHGSGVVERVYRSSFDTHRLLAKFTYDRNFFVRPQIFQKLQSGFNEQMPIRDDYDLILRISEIGLVYHIPLPLHNNIVENNNESTQQSIDQCEMAIKRNAATRRNKSNG